MPLHSAWSLQTYHNKPTAMGSKSEDKPLPNTVLSGKAIASEWVPLGRRRAHSSSFLRKDEQLEHACSCSQLQREPDAPLTAGDVPSKLLSAKLLPSCVLSCL